MAIGEKALAALRLPSSDPKEAPSSHLPFPGGGRSTGVLETLPIAIATEGYSIEEDHQPWQ